MSRVRVYVGKPSYDMRYAGIVLIGVGSAAAIVGGWGWLWAVVAWIAGLCFCGAQKTRYRQLVERAVRQCPIVGKGHFYFRVHVENEEEVNVRDMREATRLVQVLTENSGAPWEVQGEGSWSSCRITLFRVLKWDHDAAIPVQRFTWNRNTSEWVRDEEWSVESGREAAVGAVLEENARIRRLQAAAAAESSSSHTPRSSSWP